MDYLEKGTIVDERFEVHHSAGVGGMGRVYRARDLTTGALVALKVLIAQTADNTGRFRREARVLSELGHPGIVRYIASGLVDPEHPYLVMEWVGGVSLGDKLAQRVLGVSASLLLLRRLSEALGAAHAQGIVHRDLKPSNIHLFDGDLSKPKILDFGLARASETSQEITKSGVMLGTPAYMAPEQARNAADLDASADIFALGCILYECLTGRRAFSGPNVVSVLCKVLLEDPPPVRDVNPDVPEALSDLVARMLAKESAHRPRDAQALREELELRPKADATVSGRRGIGDAEARFHSVILAGWPEQVHAPDTLTMTTGEYTRSALELALDRWAPALEWMVDGTLVLTLSGDEAATDSAARAARCALAVRDLLPTAPLVLATGRAVMSGTHPVGEVIDTASTLLDRAAASAVERRDAGPILLDPVTAALLDPSFDARELEGCTELLGHRGEAGGVRPLLGRQSICVGRARELATLHATFEECVEDGLSRALLITGPPGIGKSRLLGEFLESDGAISEGARVLQARIDPLGAGAAFGVVARLVRSAAGLTEGDRPERAQIRIAAMVGELFGKREDALRVTHFLAELVGVPFAPETSVQLSAARHDPVLRGDQIRRAFAQWLEAECRRGTVLLVVEDMQWGDRPSVEMLDAALRKLEDLPLMVLALARPEIQKTFAGLWADRGVTSIALGPLRRRAGLRLVRAALPDVDDERAHELVARSGGNPFFLEELVRAQAAGRGDKAPETVLAMAQGRLVAQSEEGRRLLRAGSVFGESFWIRAAAHVLGGASANELAAEVQTLVTRELLVRAESSRFTGEDEFQFAHGLWRDAAYATLTEADRSLAHRLAAEWLMARGYPEPFVLAEHLRLGGELGRAADLYRRAAEQALAADDLDAALARVRAGLEAGVTGAEAGELLRVEAEVHKWRGENVEAARAASDALEHCAPGGASFFIAAGEALAASGKLGRVDDLSDLAARVYATTPEESAIPARLTALARGVTQLVLAGRQDETDPYFVELDAVGATEPASLGWVFEARALRASVRDDIGDRVELAEQAARAFERVGDLRNACLQLTSRGFGLNELGAFSLAESALRQAVDIAGFMGLNNALSTAQAQLGRAVARQGRSEEAEQALLASIQGFAAQGNTRLEGFARSTLAWLLLERGGLGPAEEEARRALTLLDGVRPLLVGAEAVLASVLLARDQPKEALAHARVAAELAERLGSVPTGEGLARQVFVAALLANGEVALAEQARATAHARLVLRADAIQDPELRRAFLEDVREHAQTWVS